MSTFSFRSEKIARLIESWLRKEKGDDNISVPPGKVRAVIYRHGRYLVGDIVSVVGLTEKKEDQ